MFVDLLFTVANSFLLGVSLFLTPYPPPAWSVRSFCSAHLPLDSPPLAAVFFLAMKFCPLFHPVPIFYISVKLDLPILFLSWRSILGAPGIRQRLRRALPAEAGRSLLLSLLFKGLL